MNLLRLFLGFIVVGGVFIPPVFGASAIQSPEEVLYSVEQSGNIIRSFKVESITRYFREKEFIKESDPSVKYELFPEYKKTERLASVAPYVVKDIRVETPERIFIIDPSDGSVRETPPEEELPWNTGDRAVMDYEHHTRQFIANHELFIRKDLSNGQLYVIEAVAEFSSPWYKNMLLTVDYSRGVVMSAEYFNQKDSPLRKIVNSGFQEVVPGFWFPFSREETIRELDGRYIRAETVYSRIRINVDLSEIDFDPAYILRQGH